MAGISRPKSRERIETSTHMPERGVSRLPATKLPDSIASGVKQGRGSWAPNPLPRSVRGVYCRLSSHLDGVRTRALCLIKVPDLDEIFTRVKVGGDSGI